MRVGIGYDIHRFNKGDGIVLGGIYFPFDKTLSGHSDADVLIHAICDALLGASGKGDLGTYFPDTDPSLKGISGMELLKKVKELIDAEGYRISYIDSTVIAEAPKLSKHRDEISKNITKILEIESHKVHVKATTNEGLGPLGRGEGIAAFAVCLLEEDGSQK